MTYRPREEVYGPPMIQRVLSFVHAIVAAAVVATILLVERGPRDGELYRYMFQQKHVIDARTVAIFVVISAVASLLRAGMRGVRIHGDAVEYRDVISNLWPRVRRYKWAQIDQITFEPSGSISLDLWDGTRQFLPAVGDRDGLAQALERVALARAIPLRGGRGFDDYPESADFPENV